MNKKAVLIDDSTDFVNIIAASLRCFAGYDTEHKTSIEAFAASIGWDHCHHLTKLSEADLSSLAEKLRQFSCLTFDNNFYPIGDVQGSFFLYNAIGPALLEIPKEERPLIVCFAPSSQTALAAAEKGLWDKFGILSFHKMIESTIVGLATRIAEEYGCALSREVIIRDVLGLSLTEFEVSNAEGFTPKGDLHLGVQQAMYDLEDVYNFPVEGEGRQIEYQEVVEIFARELKTPTEELSRRIEGQVALVRRSTEGKVIHGKERE